MFKNVAKFFGMAVGIVILGVAALLGVQYFKSRNNPEYQILQNIKEQERKYAEDSYGGDTPEETLRLFIEALKAGDTELAAKYFVLDKQREWLMDLETLKDKKLLGETISDLGNLKLSKKTETETFFSMVGDDGFGINVIMYKNKLNNRWKIGEF